MDIRYINELINSDNSDIKQNNSNIGRVARIRGDSTTIDCFIFETIAKDPKLEKVLLWATHRKGLQAVFYTTYKTLLVFDTSQLNVDGGIRIRDVGKAISALLLRNDIELEYITTLMEAPNSLSGYIPLHDYPAYIERFPTAKLTSHNIMDFYVLMSDFFVNTSIDDVDGLLIPEALT